MSQLHLVSVGPNPSTLPPLGLPAGTRWFSAPGSIRRVAEQLSPDTEITEVPELSAPGDTQGVDLVHAGTNYLTDGATARDDWTPRVELTLGAVNVALAITASFPGEDCVLVADSITATLLVSALTGEKPDVDNWRSRRQIDHCSLDLLPEDNFAVATRWGG